MLEQRAAGDEQRAASFELGGRTWTSRLIVGTGGFRSLEQMEAALRAAGTEIVTVALRRVDPGARGSLLEVIERLGLFALPNTAGCYTARDAVRTARLAQEASGPETQGCRGVSSAAGESRAPGGCAGRS